MWNIAVAKLFKIFVRHFAILLSAFLSFYWEKKEKKRKKSKEKSYEVWETLSAPPDFVSLKGGGVILCSGGLVLVRGATAIVK